MKRIAAVFALLAVLGGSAHAGLAGDLRTWFQHFKEGLAESSITAERQKVSVTSVAAVRGGPKSLEEAGKPTWKDPALVRKERALKKQKAELAAAVELVLQGQLADGDAKLVAFEKAYPGSPYAVQARQAREKIKQAQQP